MSQSPQEYLPTPDEEKLLKAYKGSIDLLGQVIAGVISLRMN
jgi:hypothetical protein